MDKDVVYLSSLQKNIYNLEKYYKNSCINNISGHFIFKGKKLSDVILAVKKFVIYNDSFSMKLNKYGEMYLDKIENIEFQIINLNSYDEYEKIKKQIPKNVFNIYDRYLFDIKIYVINKDIIVTCNMHHLISDAWTINLMVNEVSQILQDIEKGEDKEYNFPSYFEYLKNYGKQDQKILKRQEKDKIYWEDIFSIEPNVLILNNKKTSIESKRKVFEIPEKLTQKILDYSNENGISDYIFLLGIFTLYFSKVYSFNDYIIGNPTLNRANYKQKHTTGMFVSISPFRVVIDENLSFLEYLQKLSKDQKKMYRHLNIEYEQILKQVTSKYDIPNILYDIVFSYQNYKMDSNSLWFHTPNQKESLQIHIKQINNSLSIFYDYLIDVFDSNQIDEIHNRILYIISQVLEENKTLDEIEVITKSDLKFLDDFNNTKTKFPNSNIVTEFEKVASKNPNKIAIIDDENSYTYEYLNNMANIVAKKINSQNIQNQVIGIALKRNVNIAIAILAILKSNNIYMPIDPNYPQNRVEYMLKHSKTKLVLTSKDVLLELNTNKIFIDELKSNYLKYNSSEIKNLNLKIMQDNLAYIMYTSGSTGNPKPVAIKHKNVINFANSVNKILKYENDNVISITTICFDIFVFEFFPTLLFGQTLVIANQLQSNNPKLLKELILKNNITKIMTTPSRISLIFDNCDEYPKCIKQYILGGEPINSKLLFELQKTNSQVFNMYGPTETCVYSSFCNLTNSNEISIGKPIDNTRIYILNKKNQILANNIPGQIAIAGRGVGAGYFQEEELTNESFIKVPFEKDKIYLTGDIGFIDKNKNLQILGRKDSQVKFRGYRIELNDISNCVIQYNGISKAVTIIKEHNEKQYIVTYYESQKRLASSSIKQFLQKYLPYYMIPNIFVHMTKLPVSYNHKIDRKKLPEPDFDNILKTQKIMEPKNATETIILDCIKQCLKLDVLSVEEDLFEYNIDSLEIIRIQTKLLNYDIKLNTNDFYERRTIRQIAKQVEKEQKQEQKDTISYEKENYLKSVNNSFEKFPNLIELKKIDFSNIILLGSTGFLGIYLLNSFLEKTNLNIVCPIRAQKAHEMDKLNNRYKYYFNTSLDKYIKNKRLIILNSNILDQNLGIENIQNYLTKDTLLINAAANVGYYGNYTDFKNINVDLVSNIIELQKKYDFYFIHMSSTGVSGNMLVTNSSIFNYFSENQFYINQNYKQNVYVRTKFEAEEKIFKEKNKYNLKTAIFRIGNLMPDSKTAKFQLNYTKNAFFNIILLILGLGAVPKTLIDSQIEMTPIDKAVSAILNLIFKINFSDYVYHIFNNNLCDISQIINCANSVGFNISDMTGPDYSKYVIEIANNYENCNLLKGLVNDLDKEFGIKIDNRVVISNSYTNLILKSCGFSWDVLDDLYFFNIIDYILKNDYLQINKAINKTNKKRWIKIKKQKINKKNEK